MARRDVWDTERVNSSSGPEPSSGSAPDDSPRTSGTPSETVPPETPGERPLRPRRIGLVAVLAAVIIALDQVTKLLVVANLDPAAPPKRILGGLVYLSLFRNAGAAFSTATGVTWVLALVAIAVVVIIIRMASKLRSTAWAIAGNSSLPRR